MKSKFTFIAVILFLGYGILLALGSNKEFPTKIYYGNFFPYLADKPVSEDGYYLLTAAWNIAENKGLVYNYNRPTTGVQPLAAFFYAGLAKVVIIAGGGKSAFVRAIIIVSFLLELMFYFGIKRISENLFPSLEDKYLKPAAIILTLFNFELLTYFANGLETGLYLVLFSITILYSFIYFNGKKSVTTSLVFGFIAGVCCLARIDFIAALAVFLIVSFLLKQITIKNFGIISIAAAVVVVPWILYVYHISGSIFQSSASAQSAFISSGNFLIRLKAMALAFMQHLTPDVYTARFYVLPFVIAGAVAVVYYLLPVKEILNIPKGLNGKIILAWAVGILVLLALYLLFSYAYYFYLRYTTPLLLIVLPVFAILIGIKLSRMKERWIRAVLFLFICLFGLRAVHQYHLGKLGMGQSLRVNYIRTHFNKSAAVGCFQSGVTGYYDSNVYNLDGKMDHVVQRYSAESKLPEFLDSVGINVVIEWRSVEWLFKDKDFSNKWTVYSSNIGDDSTVCLVRKSDFDRIVKRN